MGIWSNLLGSAVRSVTFNASDNLGVLPATFYKRFVRGKGGRLHYKSRSAYKSVVAYRVFRTAVSAAYDEVNALVPRYQKFLRETMRKPVQEQQEGNRKLLVLNSRFTDKGLGTVLMDDGVHQCVAKDAWGRKVEEALMLYYVGDEDIQIRKSTISNGKQEVVNDYVTKTVVFADVAPQVSVSTTKNVVLTQVQGRDYTRKELVSGGDLSFKVSGTIVSNFGALQQERYEVVGGHKYKVQDSDYYISYPEEDVRKFIQIMQYNGIINVNHYVFKELNVDKVIIQDFSLGEQENKNVQPYSFTCVAVEPDEDVIITDDTIRQLNSDITLSNANKWTELLLNERLGQIATGVGNTALTGLLAAGEAIFSAIDGGKKENSKHSENGNSTNHR